MTFRVNQKVVCVDNSGCCEPRPVKGRVYTIATVAWQWGVTLIELPTVETYDHYAEFHAWRFRPIVERKTSIEIFQRMLLPQGENADA